MKNKKLEEEIKIKRKKLETAKKNLKNHFVGLDNIIDNIFSNFEVWYLTPQLLTKPIIINLWGMTGVGKTDLIRRLTQELEFEDRYVEVQMDTGKTSGYYYTIKNCIKNSNISTEEPGIMFLDEIQRFRSVNEEGHLIENVKFQDIWMLLSDGQFSDYNKERQELELVLLDLLFDRERERKELEEDEEKPKKGKKVKNKDEPEVSTSDNKKYTFKSGIWAAEYFKSRLEIENTIGEIMTWDTTKKIRVVENKLKNIKLSKKIRRYSKLLIFISGNLDEAYEMAEDVSEVNIDADILHEFSKKIDILKIKRCLLAKFKAEQISRFGNTHIIYPSLSKNNFKKLISKKLEEIINNTYNKFKIKIKFDDTVDVAIYRNGVYPTQGVRPLFSTISSVVENSLPIFLFHCLLQDQEEIYLKINEKDEMIFSKINGKIYEKNINLEIDKLSKNKTEDEIALIGVHESGHAVVYSLLSNLVPAQIVCNSNSDFNSGFMIPHKACRSKRILLEEIQILLAGTVAEEIVFGEEYKTIGNSNDIIKATEFSTGLIRRYNMDGFVGNISVESDPKAPAKLLNVDETNSIAEQILKEQKAKTRDLLQKNLKFFKAIFNIVLEKKRLLPEEFYEIAKKFVPNIKIKSSEFVRSSKYSEMAKKFLDKNEKGKNEV